MLELFSPSVPLLRTSSRARVYIDSRRSRKTDEERRKAREIGSERESELLVYPSKTKRFILCSLSAPLSLSLSLSHTHTHMVSRLFTHTLPRSVFREVHVSQRPRANFLSYSFHSPRCFFFLSFSLLAPALQRTKV